MRFENGQSKGFGFVCFATSEAANEALGMHGRFVGSKPLYVVVARGREERRQYLMLESQRRQQALNIQGLRHENNQD